MGGSVTLCRLGGCSPSGVLVGGVGCGAWRVVVVLWVFAFLTRGSSVALLLLVARLVLGEEFILVVPQVGCVDDLVEVLSCLFLLLEWVCGRSEVAEVICSAVGSVDHEGGFEEVLLAWEVCRESPGVCRVPVVVVELHPRRGPLSSNLAPGVVFK